MVAFAKEQAVHTEVQAKAGARTTLSCEVAQAQTEVTWFKDGKKLSSSSKVHVEATGCTRRLVLQQAGKADAGEYSCEAGGQKVSFHLDVTGGCQGWMEGVNTRQTGRNEHVPSRVGDVSASDAGAWGPLLGSPWMQSVPWQGP